MKFASKIDGPRKSYFEWGNPDSPHVFTHGHFNMEYPQKQECKWPEGWGSLVGVEKEISG